MVSAPDLTTKPHLFFLLSRARCPWENETAPKASKAQYHTTGQEIKCVFSLVSSNCFLVDLFCGLKVLKMIPRESNKGYIAKTGRSVCTRVIREHDKDRYTTFPYP